VGFYQRRTAERDGGGSGFERSVPPPDPAARRGAGLRCVIGIAAVSVLTCVPAGAVEVVQGPTLTMDPNGTTPLAGVVELETDTPVEARLTISGGSGQTNVSFPGARKLHQLPVLGLEPDRSYTVQVELDPGGLVGSLLALTAPLPDDFPLLTLRESEPAEMEPGYTLIDCFSRSGGDPRPRYTMIVDAAGTVVWYSTICMSATRQLINGELYYRSGAEVRQIDMLGNSTLSVALDHPAANLHHDLLRTPMGTYLSLSREPVEVEDFPTSQTDPGAPTATTTVRDEPVVEFLPDGTLRAKWPLTEILHPTRIGYDSLSPTGQGVDWVHTNAVVYDPGDDSIVVSARHQDAVFKFARATGELRWIVGDHANWPPEFLPFLLQPIGAPFRWQYHQHAPMFSAEGTLVVFDNGNHRASPFDGNPPLPNSQNFSRGVEYEIDEGAMEIRQRWEYGENVPDRLYAGFICDADWQPTTGNVVMTFGSVSYVNGATSASQGFGTTHTRIIEATDDLVPLPVFELILHDSQGGNITVFRSERIPSLYPQQYVKPPNGIGATLVASKAASAVQLGWAGSPVDAEHDAAEYYMLYASGAPQGGFTMLDTSVPTTIAPDGEGAIEFYKVTAANVAGTSGDEPAP